jgi:DNA-binding transcriptional LysR family regulator
MDLRHLQTFHAIVREGSFLGAARALGLAQPTVSLHVKELESELGLPLFDRSGRQRLCTAAGDVMSERALPIIESVEALVASVAELRDGRSGTLRAGAIEPAASHRLTPLLARLRAGRPGLSIRLEVGGTTSVSRAVADAEVEVGVCSAPPTELGLAFEPLFDEELVLLVPRAHRLARAKSVTPSDLDGEPLVLTERGCAYRQAVDAAFQSRGARAVLSLECGSVPTLCAAVRHGLGIAVLPRLSVTPAPAGTVVRRVTELPIALRVGLITRRRGPKPSPVLGSFLESLRRELRTHPAPGARQERRRRTS